MKYFIAIVALAALAAAKPQGQEPIAIVRQSSDVQPNQYNYQYETANGIKAEEAGVLKAAQNEEGQAISAQGSYSYQDPEGNQVQIQYIADENGFQPQGAHLPVGPEVPQHISRALDFIAAHPELVAKNSQQ